MPDIILHQYATSPFSEKVRLVLGAKGLSWNAVEIPPIMPKPDVIALTGGYRRTPVMQIGADIYCDSALICEVLDRLAPNPPLYPALQAAQSRLAAAWIDSALFTATVAYTMQPAGVQAMLAHLTPAQIQAFMADRKAMRGDTNALRMPLPEAAAMLHETLARLQEQFAAGVQHVAGPELSIADFSLFHCIWFIRRATPLAALLDGYPLVKTWFARMQAYGHGKLRVIPSESAVAEAYNHDPLPHDTTILPGGGFAAGDAVTVTPTDYAKDPVSGLLLTLSERVVTIRRQDPRAGAVNVHFPRQNYHVQAAA
ncbi:MAG: glutathione S-transferase family protein [Cupriavidus sp.]|jgi:glutathione S-transferase|nr:glutathione S-transferase family protein [Cupriavidus pauculus]MBU66727.1 glutathione S-transferase family protein [Cupriavidus sp.]MBY4729310.1 glutathione S-transferase family protein [Cupriavidus pauculus]